MMRILSLNGWLGKEEQWFWRHLGEDNDVNVEFLRKEMWSDYKMTPFNRIFRYDASMLFYGLKAFQKMKDYDAIVSSHLSFGAPLAFLRGITGTIKPLHLIITFIIHENMRKRLPFLRVALKGLDLAVCHSRYEVDHYPRILKTNTNKFIFIPLGVDTDVFKPIDEMQEKGYILAIGQESRDYRTFFDAVRYMNYPVWVITSQASLKGLDIPPSVKIFNWLSLKDFIKVTTEARCVVVPLQNRSYSSGQQGFLAAMALGKAVIVTSTPGTVDYVYDGINGMLVQPGDVLSMQEKIKMLMDDPQLSKRIGIQARKMVEDEFSERIFANKIYDLVVSKLL